MKLIIWVSCKSAETNLLNCDSCAFIGIIALMCGYELKLEIRLYMDRTAIKTHGIGFVIGA